jgi:GT2 family glycosyltransferase
MAARDAAPALGLGASGQPGREPAPGFGPDPARLMRVIGHIHTLNDEEVIDLSVRALLAQTHPLQEIVVVDNGSTDATLHKLSSQPVTVLRHAQNLGTSGAVVTGIRYALAKRYDWIWVFDADSAPRKDALQKLVELYTTLSPDLQRQVWLLASLHVEAATRTPHYEMVFGRTGFRRATPAAGSAVYAFDSTIWSGSLYRLDAVQKVGLPSLDYVLDWGEHEYGYRGRRSGYKAFVHAGSIVDHNIGAASGLQFTTYRFGPLAVVMRELPPIRCYYLTRNLLYFWLYEYRPRALRTTAACALRVVKLTASFLLRLPARWPEFSACLRGIGDGVLRRMERRF